MKKTHCYSVRLDSLRSISPKAYLAKGFDGSEAILPKSQVMGPDYDVSKSEAWWIASWILEQKNLQYSEKKEGWYNPATGRVEPVCVTVVEKHIPVKMDPIKSQADASLTRSAN